MEKTCILYQRRHLINSSGGAERIICQLANALSERHYRVILLTNDPNKGRPFYPLDTRIIFKNLGGLRLGFFRYGIFKVLSSITNTRKKLFKIPFFDQNAYLAKILWQFIVDEHADGVISCGLTELMELTYHHEPDKPLIQMFHGPPDVYFKNNKAGRLLRLEEGLKKICAAQILLGEYTESLRQYYQGVITVIGNAVPPASQQACVRKSGPRRIIYLARLEPGKQQALLIRAFANLADIFPDWSVHLFGTGKRKQIHKLDQLIRALRLESRVFLRGVTADVYHELVSADICAFPSESEGFGLGLAEAMSVGLPCIGLRCASGIRFLLQNGSNGILTDNTVDAFCDGLRKLMSNSEIREQFGRKGRSFVKQFTPSIIWDRWDKLLHEYIGNPLLTHKKMETS